MIPDGDFKDGCDLPKYRRLHVLNTRDYKPVGWRETFNSAISLFGLWPVSNQKKHDLVNYTFKDGDIRAAVERLQESLNINHVKETSHLVITVESLDSKEAANIVSCLRFLC